MIKHLYNYADGKKKPFATIAIVDGNVGLAVCSSKDQFNKKRGREIALARATKGTPPQEVSGSVFRGGRRVTKDAAIADAMEWMLLHSKKDGQHD